jgi:hypothetical protein
MDNVFASAFSGSSPSEGKSLIFKLPTFGTSRSSRSNYFSSQDVLGNMDAKNSAQAGQAKLASLMDAHSAVTDYFKTQKGDLIKSDHAISTANVAKFGEPARKQSAFAKEQSILAGTQPGFAQMGTSDDRTRWLAESQAKEDARLSALTEQENKKKARAQTIADLIDLENKK